MIPGIIPYNEDDEPHVKWLKLIVLIWMIIACWIVSLPNKPKPEQQPNQHEMQLRPQKEVSNADC